MSTKKLNENQDEEGKKNLAAHICAIILCYLAFNFMFSM